ncbi:DNA-binding transcriptional ArsR family regulator [Melghirimyces profundicolus]|uniref:DNA-binding transcriptional ArsR family regulator n=1 Tax=Melghirimyces profundicolus TaxID=1242148 RepID=A0A2T6BG61_9BACL|nr:DNA-binding transcriptional ArsR family regulator [Melghirimyces profundicolus]
MQIQRLVDFHKALADPTRIRILLLLTRQPLHGQAIAGKLGITPPTVTHHMARLREAGLVRQRRVKNTQYFHLDRDVLKRKSRALLNMMEDPGPTEPDAARFEQGVHRNFFTPDGKLKQLPAQRKKRLIVLRRLAGCFKGESGIRRQTSTGS